MGRAYQSNRQLSYEVEDGQQDLAELTELLLEQMTMKLQETQDTLTALMRAAEQRKNAERLDWLRCGEERLKAWMDELSPPGRGDNVLVAAGSSRHEGVR